MNVIERMSIIGAVRDVRSKGVHGIKNVMIF